MTEGSHVMTMSEVDEDKQRAKHCIYRLPPRVRMWPPYQPLVISFGPYYRHEYSMWNSMADMEPYKKSALDRFLKRCGKSMDDCVELMKQKGLPSEWMDAYDCLGTYWQENMYEFVVMMVTDGCFMLEILLYRYKGRKHPELSYQYPTNHRVFSEHGELHMIPDIRRDMLMLENQLPISVLAELLSMSVQHPELLREIQNDYYLLVLMADFCGRCLSDFPPEHLDRLKTGKHVLDVCGKMLIGDTAGDGGVKKITAHGEGRYFLPIPSATRLHEAGVAFVKVESAQPGYINHIEFLPGHLGGILKIPPLGLFPFLESFLLNMWAFERYHPGTGKEATCYLFLLSSLLANDKDVSLLKSRGILNHAFENDLIAAKLFEGITAAIISYNFPEASHAHVQVLEFCDKPWIKLRRRIIHTYFTDPWTPLLRFAGFVFFALTLVQTVYTVGQYYQ